MAAPSFIAASTGATDAGGAWTATCHAPGAAGRIIILQVLQDGATASTVTLNSATNIENLAGTDNAWTSIGAFAVGSATAAYQHLWIGRSLSTSAPTATGSNGTSEDLYWRFYEFDNVATAASGADTLAEIIENSTAGSTTNSTGTDATATDASVTTLGPDRFALNFVAVNDDNAISAFTGETGGDWTLAVAPYAEASGTDGAIALQIAYPGTILSFTPTTTGNLVTGAANALRWAQSFTTPSDAPTLVAASVNVGKVGTVTDNVVIAIQADSAGEPSGTDLASDSTVGSTLNTYTASSPVAWTGQLSLAASTKYWLVITRDGAEDAINCYRVMQTGTPYADGEGKAYVSGAWGAASTDRAFTASLAHIATIDGGSGSIVDSDAWGVVGFALIGTTVTEVAYVPRHPAHDFGSVTNF